MKIKKYLVFSVLICMNLVHAGVSCAWNELTTDDVTPMHDTPKVQRVASGKFLANVDFGKIKSPRASWDFNIKMDLRREVGLEFDFFCSDTAQCSTYNIYLKSGKGWYYAVFSPREDSRWHRIRVDKSDFSGMEGKVAGWGKIDAVRISCWRFGYEQAKIGIAELDCVDVSAPQVCVVRGDSCATNTKYGSECPVFGKFSSITARAFENVGMTVIEVSDMELDENVLEGIKLLIFPYNPSVPKYVSKVVEKFLNKDGVVFACHATDPLLRRIIGIDEGKYRNRNWRGSSSKPVKTKNGYFLDHVWRYGHEDSLGNAYDLLVKINPHWKKQLDAVQDALAKSEKDDLQWIASQPSKEGEWRAFWCHSARGLGKGYDWDSSIRLLKENGFNTILPNLAWAGLAFYESSVLPVDPSVRTEGDALKSCLAACRKYGVKCHVWKVCWKGRGTTEFFKNIPEDRIQVDVSGMKQNIWLCPSHPENLKMEMDAFLELAKMGVDGIHFDYIRYPSEKNCFCFGCRERFEKQIGRKVENWPQDVRKKDSELFDFWKRFREANITALIKGVSQRVRNECPGIEVSAAVFHGYNSNASSVGQNWVQWCKDGYLDFVCPMNYYGGSNKAFENLVNMQCNALKGSKVKMRPGLGLSCWKERFKDALTMTKQIKIVRNAGLDGFIVFDYDERAAKVLPIVHKGPTR